MLSAAVSGGKISIVSNVELRLKMISWETRLSDTRYIIELDNHELLERQFPAFGARDLLLAGFVGSPCLPGNPEVCPGLTPIHIAAQDLPDTSTLANDVELRGVLAERTATLSDEIDFGLNGLEDGLSEIILEIEKELERP